jgi:general secretion pathway protein M
MTFSERLQALRDWWERLSQRERTLVGSMCATFVILVTLGVGYFITDGLETLDQRNSDMRQALRDLDTQRDAYLRMKAKSAQLETRLGQMPVQFQGYLEAAAKEAGVEIPESTPHEQATSNKAFIERSVDLRLGAVTLEQLTKFMRAVETGRSMVVVSQLNVRTRDDKHQQLDVTMSVSTYERRVDSGKSTGKSNSNSKEDKN